MIDADLRDPVHNEVSLLSPYFLRFERGRGLIGSHPILTGRSAAERVSTVVTFGGQALQSSDPAVTSLLLLSEHAEIVDDPNSPTHVRSAAGMSHAVAVEYASGRVVVAGEAALFTTQVWRGKAAQSMGAEELPIGFDHEGADNRQFVLNIVRWLSRAL